MRALPCARPLPVSRLGLVAHSMVCVHTLDPMYQSHLTAIRSVNVHTGQNDIRQPNSPDSSSAENAGVLVSSGRSRAESAMPDAPAKAADGGGPSGASPPLERSKSFKGKTPTAKAVSSVAMGGALAEMREATLAQVHFKGPNVDQWRENACAPASRTAQAKRCSQPARRSAAAKPEPRALSQHRADSPPLPRAVHDVRALFARRPVRRLAPQQPMQ